MKRLKTIIFPFILLLTISTFSQEQPKEIVKKFFNDYQKENISIALDKLYKSNQWIIRNTDAINNLKSQMKGLNVDFVGKYNGYELIVEKKMAESYLLLSYMVKFDRQPIRYTFQFYKPKEKWIIHSFKFDVNIDDEIEEAAKLYYLNLNN